MDPRFPTSSLSLPWALCASSLLCAASPAIAEEATADAAPTQAAVSAPDQRSAEQHLARGLELYGQKRYAEAVEEFRAGYAVNADLRLLYALAQALRLAGQCSEAVVYYQRFLDRAPGPAQEAAARANLQRCREQASNVSAPGPGESAPKPAETAPPPRVETPLPRRLDTRPVQPDTAATAEAPRASRPPPPGTHDTPAWYADPLGATLTGGGLLGLGAGVALLVSANSRRIEANRLENGATQGTYQDHADRLDTGRVELLSGGVSAAVGLTAIVLGAFRYQSVAARQSVRLSWTVLPSRAAATLGGTF